MFSKFNIIKDLAGNETKPEWEKYTIKQAGRKKFQIDLALSLIKYGIKLDWKAPYDESSRPQWMQQASYIHYNCGVCFLCKEGKTTGIQSKPPTGLPARSKQKAVGKSTKCTKDRVNLG